MKHLLLILLFVIVILPATLYLTIIHPNDSRVSEAKIDLSTKIEKTFESILDFDTNIYLTHSLDHKDYIGILDKIAPNFNYHLQYQFPRLNDQYLIFTSPGLYPYRVDGRYGFLIPNNTSIKLEIPYEHEVRMEFAAYAFGQSMSLKVYSNQGPIIEKQLEMIENKLNFPEWLGSLGKYLLPDFVKDPLWTPISIAYSPKHAPLLEFTCEGSEQGYCIISKPSFTRKEKQQKKKNIIMILVDTMRFDAISEQYMPHTKKFIDSGFAFTKALAPGNMTSPSTNSILSCRMPHHIKDIAFSYGLNQIQKDRFYEEKFLSFPEILKDAGWKTAMLGNISVISEVIGQGIDHGFEQQIAMEKDGYETAQMTREAQRWLVENHQTPFFLYIHYHAPHGPYRAPLSDIIATFPGIEAFKSFPSLLKWLYNAELHYTDRYLKKIFETIDKLNLGEQTSILLTSDHGDHHQEREFISGHKDFSLRGAYFDHGATLYQDEIGVPLAIKNPDIQAGTDKSTFVSTMSIGPTLLELNDLPVPHWCDQPSLVKTIEKKADEPKLTITSEGFRGKSIIFDNRYKYIKHYKPTRKKIHKADSFSSIKTSLWTREELYDLTNDVDELSNLFRSQLNLLEKARSIFKQHFQDQDLYKLVVESPESELITVNLPKQQEFSTEQDIKTTEFEEHKKLEYLGNRLILESNYFHLDQIKIFIGDKAIEPLMSTSRLPIKTPPELLPHEIFDPESQPPAPDYTAYLIKLDPLEANQMMSTTNKEFEKIMREWGYINEG